MLVKIAGAMLESGCGDRQPGDRMLTGDFVERPEKAWVGHHQRSACAVPKTV
ncbi:hypothetical protein [Nocardioides sp. Soil805]|uniref:hypothetical protein n=1 Tax=Nocardioides sp. Soil805 TaxID=1736416 RepID=UPI000B230076|nr:hypothetical protein [Nocardioides sp. Soil805]